MEIFQGRSNDSKRFQKSPLNISTSFRKLNMMQWSLELCKIIVLELTCTVLLLQLQNNWILADILADYFLPTDSCFMQMKNTLTHLANYEKTIFDKNII